MLRKEFIGSALALVVGVNLAAWALTVPTKGSYTPVGTPALVSVSQTASVEAVATTSLSNEETVASSTSATTTNE